MTHDDLTMLRGLDHAPASDLSAAEAARAAQGLDRILAGEEPGTTGALAVGHLAVRARRRAARRVGIPVAVAAAAAAAFALPFVGPAPHALASWTPEPDALSPQDLAVLDAACRSRIGPERSVTADDVVLAERRGSWAAVMYLYEDDAAGQTLESSCIGYLPPGADGAEDVSGGTASSGGVAPTPRGVVAGSMSQWGGRTSPWSRERPLLSMTNGLVGADVASLTLRLADGTAVETTLDEGVFVAWWPGEVFDPATIGGPGGQGGPEPAITYEATYTDGTTRTVTPELPD
ncbi:hypothetical protein G8C93_08235 [Cellulosimicrobium cellulans]|uniref:hypothetical protein n=1 Tax=Cellulosimicrobium cellulans TaxID=1710 RepID=UPI001883499C|nr:hypothetical protein [Cellulosimicrobium cellulans]MBE9925879.1 hypothetical protein [Cellulosimicrobium cellulans]